jgi:hypothetical protein
LAVIGKSLGLVELLARADPGGALVADWMGFTPVHWAFLRDEGPEAYDVLISGVVNEGDLRALNTPGLQAVCQHLHKRNRIEDTMRERGIDFEGLEETEEESG